MELNILRFAIDPQKMFLTCGASLKRDLQLSQYSNERRGDMDVFGKAIHVSAVDLNILNERYVEKKRRVINYKSHKIYFQRPAYKADTSRIVIFYVNFQCR